jgi:hypothetical protein
LILDMQEKCTPDGVADVTAVKLNMAAARVPDFAECRRCWDDANSITVSLIMSPAAYRLTAAAVEALLRLAVQLHGRVTASKHVVMCSYEVGKRWSANLSALCGKRSARQLPAATVLELAHQALQHAGTCAPLLAAHLFDLARVSPNAAQVKSMLSLLKGPPAAVEPARGFVTGPMRDYKPVIVWLAQQPGAAAAAAELGLTRADVPDLPYHHRERGAAAAVAAAAALLSGDQEEGAANDT